MAVLVGITAQPLWAQGRAPLWTLANMAIQSHGRLMPLDTFARLTLYELSGRTRVRSERALSWLARLLFLPETTEDDPVFLVNHPDTPAALGLPERGRDRYSYREVSPGLDRLATLARAAQGLETPDGVDRDLARLEQAIAAYKDLRAALDYARPDPAASGLTLAQLLDDPRAGGALLAWTGRGWSSPLKVIPDASQSPAWLSPETALLQGGRPAETSHTLADAAAAWGREDWATTRAALERFAVLVRGLSGPAGPRLALEVLYNRAHSFLVSCILALAAAAAWWIARKRAPESAIVPVLLGASFVVHTLGLAVRVLVSGRPPVTDLYSSFLFVAWVTMGLGGYLKLLRGQDAGVGIASIGGPILTLISSRFAAEGDRLGVLQAVLDSNFWLSTHVVSITLGYGVCVAAGVAAHIYLLRRISAPWEEEAHARLYRLIHGTLVVALILTFLGTVLGGIWADQSWGRFWGWDPKENGALLIILWIAILLHARLARMLGHRGVAAGAVALMLVLLFSWLGVNLMGVGLHAYGWTRGTGLVALGLGAGELLFLAVAVPLAGRSALGPTDLVRVRVRAVRRETPDTVTVDLTPRRPLAVEPGRYVTLFASVEGVTHRRAYSFSSGPRPDGSFSITVSRSEGGAVSTWIHRGLRRGHSLAVAGPAGTFGLNGEAADTGGPSPVLVAAGSGIAPLALMAETWFRQGGARLLLVYGSRDREHIIFRDRLEALAARNPGFTVRHVLADPDAQWTGERGRITGDLVLRASGMPTRRTFYVCGPEAMVDEVGSALAAAGVAPERIHTERFETGPSHAARSAGRTARIGYRRSGRVVTVRPGQSILEAGIHAGIAVPHSCVAGRCRDCAARLVSGSVCMEEPNALTPAERERGIILCCVAYPTGDAEVDL